MLFNGSVLNNVPESLCVRMSVFSVVLVLTKDGSWDSDMFLLASLSQMRWSLWEFIYKREQWPLFFEWSIYDMFTGNSKIIFNLNIDFISVYVYRYESCFLMTWKLCIKVNKMLFWFFFTVVFLFFSYYTLFQIERFCLFLSRKQTFIILHYCLQKLAPLISYLTYKLSVP